MWKRGMAKAFDLYSGGSTRRRGAKLGLLVALMAVLPGLVAGTAYITGSASGTGSVQATNQPSISCGFEATGQTDTGVFSQGGLTTTSPSSGSISVSFQALETGGLGGLGYEYLVDEFELGCQNMPDSATTVLQVQLCGLGAAPAATLSQTATCQAPTTIQSVVGADMVALDASTVAPTYGCNPTGGTSASCTTANTQFCSQNAAVTSGTVGKAFSTDDNVAAKEVPFGVMGAGSATSSAATYEVPTSQSFVPGDLNAATTGTLAPATGTPCKPTAGTATAGATVLTGYADAGTATSGQATANLQFTTECGTNTPNGCGTSATFGAVLWFSIVVVDDNNPSGLPNGLALCTYNSAGGTTDCSYAGSITAGTTMFSVAYSATA